MNETIQELREKLKTATPEQAEFGYFDYDNIENVPKALERIRHALGIYFTVNPVKPALHARAYNRIRQSKQGEIMKIYVASSWRNHYQSAVVQAERLHKNYLKREKRLQERIDRALRLEMSSLNLIRDFAISASNIAGMADFQYLLDPFALAEIERHNETLGINDSQTQRWGVKYQQNNNHIRMEEFNRILSLPKDLTDTLDASNERL